MQEFRPWVSARLSAETSAPANLDEALRWLIDSQCNPVRIAVDDVPALGLYCWLRLAPPITAPRAVICALWLIEDIDDGACVLGRPPAVRGSPDGNGYQAELQRADGGADGTRTRRCTTTPWSHRRLD
jgi:hypothetical protein